MSAVSALGGEATQLGEQVIPIQQDGFLARPLLRTLPISREVVLYAAIVALAAVLRFWNLGPRILHHDESIHAVYSWYLLTGRGYIHNPIYHGPLLYHASALMYFLFGAADATARMAPAFFGTILVTLPYLLRRELGKYGAICAAFLLAVSPSVLYYSRSLRHDIFAAAGTMALFVALWRYGHDRRPRWLYLAAAGLVTGFTSHELTFMTVFLLVIFLLPFAGSSLAAALVNRDRSALSPWAEFLLFVATLAAPQFSAAALIVQRMLNPHAVEPAIGQVNALLGPTLIGLLAVSTVVGLWWNRRIWAYGALIFYAVFILLYTGFLSNAAGFFSGAVGALQYWLTQQDVKRGGQPWFYYLVLFPLYEFLPLIFALGGVVYCAIRRHLFGLFLAYWGFASLVLFSWAGEKMPWLVMHIALPFILLAGLTIGKVVEGVNWRALWQRGAGQLALWFVLALVVLVALWNRGSPFAQPGQLVDIQGLQLQWLLLAAVFVALAVAAWQAYLRVGSGAGRVLVVAVFLLILPLSIRASWVANYYHGDTPVEMLVYTQSSPDVGKVMKEIERAGFRTGTGMDLKVAYDDNVSWPFEWYLRDYKSRNYFGNGMPATDAPIVLVGLDNDHDASVRGMLTANYVGQRYKLRWWFPEDYRDMSLQSISWFLFDPATRGKIWRYFMYRETLNPLGSTDFMMYERRDLVQGFANVTATTGPVSQQEDQYQKQTRQVEASLVFGAAGTGNGQFNAPKNLAVGPDGTIFVLDSRNQRIQKLDATARFLAQWGSGGTAPGQFSEPWGIAVSPDGVVHVADTWNHRIQKFDQNGSFLGAWGTFGNTAEGAGSDVLFGPRGVAIDKQGNVYVTDTGNHRVQKFDQDGKLLASFGKRGGREGEFNEPVGITIDSTGNIYVADTWNRRIQKFDANFQPVAQFPIAGWQSDSPNNKPYIAADANGNVYVSDPENNRIVKFGAAGTLAAVWGKYGADRSSLRMPTGLALDAKGNLFVADTDNNRIAKFAPVE